MRGIAYGSHPSLWLDEAMLSINVAERTFGALTQPLAMSQVAPIPFLWLLKAATLIGGINELSLRLVPLLAGIALLGVQWWVARRMLGASVGVAAVTLAAVSPILLYYSNEVKQYELDALTTVVIVGLVVTVLDAPDQPVRWRWLGVAGTLGLVLSQPAIFVLAGASGALLLDRRIRTAERWKRYLAGVAAVWLATFGLLYLLIYRHGANPILYTTWSATFLSPRTPGFASRLQQACRTILTLALPEAVASQAAWLLGGALLFGLWLMGRRHGAARPVLILGPFAAVLAASALGQYPLGARTLVFTAPLWILAYAATLEWLGALLPQHTRPYAWAGVLVGFGVVGLYGDRHEPWTLPVREDARGIIARVEQQRGAEPVYVYNEGLPLWAFYTTDWEASDTAHSQRVRRVAFRTREQLRSGAPHLLDSLVVREPSAQATTILGLASPARWREGRGFVQTESDSLWAVDEATRIRTAANESYVWILACHYRADQLDRLLRQLGRFGAVVVQAHTGPSAVAYRVRLPSTGPMVATTARLWKP